MKTIIYQLFTLVALISLLTSCEEVVDIDLKSAEPKLVIDATIQSGYPCIVTLSKTQAFNNNDAYERVSNAVIELSDEDGNKEILKESNDQRGLYQSSMMGSVDKEYNLKISVEGKTYESDAVVPALIPIDSVYIYNIQVGKESFYSPAIIFDDIKGIENYFYSKTTVNDKLMNTIYLDTDEFQDGVKEITNILFFNSDDNNKEELKLGDKISVEMQNINKGAFTYYNSLFTVAAGGATNPLSNISGGALGCFKAFSSSTREIIITEDHIFTKK